MDIDISFQPDDNNIQNLKVLAFKETELFELRISEIAEIADMCAAFAKELYKIGMDAYEILSVISEGTEYTFEKASEPPDANPNKDKITAFLSSSSASDRAVFCELLLEKLKKNDIVFDEESFLKKKEKSDTFIYVKNFLADEAYDVFSQGFEDPRLRYAKTFKEAVSTVIDQEVSYCLLPLEERGGTRLQAVTELIFSNSLKINSITPVFGPDGTADMKYALLSTDFNTPKFNSSDDRYFEFRIDMSDTVCLFELLTVSNAYNLRPYRINTVNIGANDASSPQYSIVLYGPGADFSPILTYLTLFSNEFTPIGIYINTD